MFNNSTMFNKVYTKEPTNKLNYSGNNILKSTFIYENGKGKIIPSKKKNNVKKNYQSFNEEFLKEFHYSKDIIDSQKKQGYQNSKNKQLNNAFVKSKNYDKSYNTSKYYHQKLNNFDNKSKTNNYLKKKSNLSIMRENERLKKTNFKSKITEIPIIVPNKKYIRDRSINISTIPHIKPQSLNPLKLDVNKNFLKSKNLKLKDMKKNLQNEAYEEYREKYNKSIKDNLSIFPDFPSWTNNNSFNVSSYNLRKTKIPQIDRKIKKKDIKREKKMEDIKKKFNIDYSNRSFIHKKKKSIDIDNNYSMIIESKTNFLNKRKNKPKLIKLNSTGPLGLEKDDYNIKGEDDENFVTHNRSYSKNYNNNILDELDVIKENKKKNIIVESSKSIKTNIKHMNGSQIQIKENEMIVKDFSKIFDLIINIVTSFLTNILNYLEGKPNTKKFDENGEVQEKEVILKLPREVTLIIPERSYNQLKTIIPIVLAILVILYLKSN